MAAMLKAFDVFFEENHAKLHMSKPINYPLNYKRGYDWSERQCDAESREFALQIITNTIHISYVEFRRRMKLVCDNLTDKPVKDALYVFVIPFEVRKSNTWASLIAYEHIRKFVGAVYCDVTAVMNDSIDSRSDLYGKNIICVLCDDCAYTGHQIANLAMIDTARLNFRGKTPPPSPLSPEWLTWRKDNDRKAQEFVRRIPIQKFSVRMVVPYMSVLAQARLKTIPYVVMSIHCLVFPIFEQIVDTTRIPINIVTEFKSTFQYHRDISAIYFDHKVADAVSTFHKIYLLAPIFNCAVKSFGRSFIEGCEAAVPDKSLDPYRYYMDLDKDLSGKTCPPTFYKTIVYTYGGRDVDGGSVLCEVLMPRDATIVPRRGVLDA